MKSGHYLRYATMLFVAVILLSCQIAAQNPKNKPKPKPKAVDSPHKTVEPPVPKPDLSKEFMVLGRKAFGAVDRLNEHFLDFKDVTSEDRSLIMKMSDEKQSWVVCATTAEQASDDLKSVAESPIEKLIAHIVSDTVFNIQHSHDLVDTETEVAVNGWNLRVLQFAQERLSSLYLGPSPVPEAHTAAMDREESRTTKLLSNPCYLAAKEAVSTGVMKACDSPENAADKNPETLTK